MLGQARLSWEKPSGPSPCCLKPLRVRWDGGSTPVLRGSPEPWVSTESGPWGSDGRALWECRAGCSLASSGLVEDKHDESGRDRSA